MIIGFSYEESPENCVIYDNEQAISVKHINAYLIDAPDIFVESRPKPICDVPEIRWWLKMIFYAKILYYRYR